MLQPLIPCPPRAGGARHLSAAAPSSETLASFLASQPALSITSTAMDSVGLTTVIDTAKDGYSFFAPTDDAWEALAQAYNMTTDDLLANTFLRGILAYSVRRPRRLSCAPAGVLWVQPALRCALLEAPGVHGSPPASACAACAVGRPLTPWARAQTSTQATSQLTAGATLPTLFAQPIMVAGAATTAGSVSTQSVPTSVQLDGQASSAMVLAAPALVDGNTWVYTVDTVLLPSLIADIL